MDAAGTFMTAWLGQQQQEHLQPLASAGGASIGLSIHHLQSPTSAAASAGQRLNSAASSVSPVSASAAADAYCRQRSEYAKDEPLSIYEPDDDGDREDSQQGRDGARSHSTPMTLKWLNDNYEIADGVCIPRSTLYQHYLDFSEKTDIIPVNAASFGKIIRQQFPQITTRRLGTRGQSKYHYYGIGVKETSPYYEFMYSKAGQQQSVHNASSKKEVCKQVPLPYSPRSRIGTILPDFPSISELKLPEDVPTDKVLTFVMMYRTHCQRILDTVIRANFDEVQNFLMHFWQGMPPHMMSILGLQPIVSLVAVCDCILYRSISSVLTPNVLQALPESLTQIIRKFAKQLRGWMHTAMIDLPESLRSMKFKVARQFTKILTLQVSLNHLCQASRTVMQSSDVLAQMLEDWQSVDKVSISKQTLYMLGSDSRPPLHIDKELDRILGFYNEFERLLQGQCPIEAYIQWLDQMIDICVIKPGLALPDRKRKISRNFLLVWSCFGTRIIRDMTLHSAPSFGSFHLLHLMFDDYILYHMELLHCQDMTDVLMRQIRGDTTTDMPELRDDLSSAREEGSAFASLNTAGSTGSNSDSSSGSSTNSCLTIGGASSSSSSANSSRNSAGRLQPLYDNGGQQQQQQQNNSGCHQDRFNVENLESPIEQKPMCLQRHHGTSSSVAPERYNTPPNAGNAAAYHSDKEQFYRFHGGPQSHQPQPHLPQPQHHQLPSHLQHHNLHSDIANNWRAAAAAAAAAAVAAPPSGPLLQHYHPCYQPPPMMSMASPFLPYAALGAPHFTLDSAGSGYPMAYGNLASDFSQPKGMKRAAASAASAAAAAAAAAAVAAVPDRGGVGSCTGLPAGMELHHQAMFGGGKRFHPHPLPESGAPGTFSFVDSAQAAYAMT